MSWWAQCASLEACIQQRAKRHALQFRCTRNQSARKVSPVDGCSSNDSARSQRIVSLRFLRVRSAAAIPGWQQAAAYIAARHNVILLTLLRRTRSAAHNDQWAPYTARYAAVHMGEKRVFIVGMYALHFFCNCAHCSRVFSPRASQESRWSARTRKGHTVRWPTTIVVAHCIACARCQLYTFTPFP